MTILEESVSVMCDSVTVYNGDIQFYGNSRLLTARSRSLFPNRIKYKIKPKSVLFACFLMRDKMHKKRTEVDFCCVALSSVSLL